MNVLLTAAELFDAQHDLLGLSWLAGRSGGERLLEPATAKFPGMALVGHLNFIHPNRVQVLGRAEVDYLRGLNPAEHAAAVSQLFSCQTTTIVIVANSDTVDPDLVEAAEAHGLPLFVSPLPSPRIINDLQYYLARALAPRLTQHGVFLEVMGVGVLITGKSGIGKSEVALELLTRHHRLVADDAVEFLRIAPDVVVGRAPGVISDFLEVRGLGILNVRDMFGHIAVRHEKTLRLVVHLEQLDLANLSRIDRLQAEQKTRPILDVPVPEVVLYVAPGRNTAVLVETAVRAHILRMRGFNPLDELMARQQAAMQGDGDPLP
jgi:HPr kinase/phosphorylase